MSRILYGVYGVLGFITLGLMYAAALCHDKATMYNLAAVAVVFALAAGVTLAFAVLTERREL